MAVRVGMVPVRRNDRLTRALRPTFMNETWARRMERLGRLRRMTAEEMAAYEASRVKVKKDVSSTIEPKVKIEGSEVITTVPIADGDLVEVETDSPEAIAEQDPLPEEPSAVPASTTRNLFDDASAPATAKRGRRSRKTSTEE